MANFFFFYFARSESAFVLFFLFGYTTYRFPLPVCVFVLLRYKVHPASNLKPADMVVGAIFGLPPPKRTLFCRSYWARSRVVGGFRCFCFPVGINDSE